LSGAGAGSAGSAGSALVRRLLRRRSVQAAAGAAAVAAAVAALAMLLTSQPTPVAGPPPSAAPAAPPPPPAATVPPPVVPSPSVSEPSSAAPPPPTPSQSPSPSSPPAALEARLEPVGTLVRGRPGVLALTVVHSGQRGGVGGSLALPDTGPLTARLTLPRGVSLRSGPAGDGWTCAAVRCGRSALAAGGTTRAYLPVTVSDTAADDPPRVQLTAPRARAVAATATAGVRASGLPATFAGTAPVALAVGGNSLLSCGDTSRTCPDARSGQRAADNGDYHMTRYTDTRAPAGYPYGAAVSGAAIPVRGKVLWAGLYWSGTGPRPNEPVARLRVPGADGYAPVAATRVDTASAADFGDVYQASADVTALARGARGGGTWWVAVEREAFKGGYNTYAGWALVVVADGGGTQRTVAVFDAFTPVARGGSYSSPLWGAPGPASIGLVAWEGDRTLAGDRLVIGGAAAGGDNVAASRSDGTPAGWHTLGTDARVLPARPRSPTLTASATTDAWLLGPVALVSG
ncbi:hypothetical protein ACTMTJ_07680, partial [Phytohabitans sp. LJ34]